MRVFIHSIQPTNVPSNVAASNVPGTTLYFLRNTQQYNHLSYNSLKTAPLCNYALLSATVKVSETFLEARWWKPFQLFRRINDVSSITKSAAPSMLISVQAGKNQLKSAQESTGYAPVLSHCSLLRNLLPKLTGVLEHCSEGETNLWLYLSGSFLLTASLTLQRMSMYISLFTVVISLNYTSDSRVIFEASTWNWSIRVGSTYALSHSPSITPDTFQISQASASTRRLLPNISPPLSSHTPSST